MFLWCTPTICETLNKTESISCEQTIFSESGTKAEPFSCEHKILRSEI